MLCNDLREEAEAKAGASHFAVNRSPKPPVKSAVAEKKIASKPSTKKSRKTLPTLPPKVPKLTFSSLADSAAPKVRA